jgi:glutaredoxin-like YruB-family protein
MKDKKNVKTVVKIYSTPTCPYCHMAKDYFKAKGVKFEDVDVSSDENAAQEMIRKSGFTGVPQIEINGKVIIGFDRAAIEKELKNL